MHKGLMTIGDWTFMLIPHGTCGDRMYVSHDCSANKSHMIGGNITHCHACKLLVPDGVQGLLELYNMDWSPDDA